MDCFTAKLLPCRSAHPTTQTLYAVNGSSTPTVKSPNSTCAVDKAVRLGSDEEHVVIVFRFHGLYKTDDGVRDLVRSVRSTCSSSDSTPARNICSGLVIFRSNDVKSTRYTYMAFPEIASAP